MRKLAIIPILLLFVTGCALTEEKIELGYAPKAGTARIEGAEKVSVSVTVADMRTDKSNKVSAKKNGFGMEMGAIFASENVTATLEKAFSAELKARGFSVGAGGR